jgi:hypothetical protein
MDYLSRAQWFGASGKAAPLASFATRGENSAATFCATWDSTSSGSSSEREAQNLRIADHVVLALAHGREPLDDAVGESICEAR